MLDLCRVTNNDRKKPFTGKYEGAKYTIKAGSESIVPRAAVNLWFGDPELVDDVHGTGPAARARTNEFNRLRTKYGAYEHDEIWEINRPNVTVTDLDGNRYYTVAEDPTGENVTPATSTPAVSQDLATEMANLRRQMEALERAQADAEAARTGQSPTEGRDPGDSSQQDGGQKGGQNQFVLDETKPNPDEQVAGSDVAPGSGTAGNDAAPEPPAAKEDKPRGTRVGPNK